MKLTDFDPTERELEALKVLWIRGEATVREVCDEINAGTNDELAYTTVLSLLQVMEQKGLVKHRREGKAYVYLPQVVRERTLRSLAASFLERVFDGSLDEYLVHALGTRKVSKRELDQLEEMLAEARKKKSSRASNNKRKGEKQ
ncbi:MAG: BlaI/MecI/CopY family transcriptional regulator [Planctomycetota bacterium]